MDKKWQVGLIRVVTLSDRDMAELHGRLIMEMFPALEVETRCIPDQPEGIHDPESKAMAVPKIIEVAKAFKDKDVIIVSCADDPGVKELRRILTIPVVGAGSSVCALAMRCGPRTGVLGITDYAPPPYVDMFGDRLVNLGRPQGVNNTLDLLTDQGQEAVRKLGMQLKEAGAQSIALACTGMSTIGITKPLEEYLGIPVIDPVTAEGLFAYYECIQRNSK